jgi:hypothetical protein
VKAIIIAGEVVGSRSRWTGRKTGFSFSLNTTNTCLSPDFSKANESIVMQTDEFSGSANFRVDFFSFDS